MKDQGGSAVPGYVVIVIDDDFAVRNSLKFSLEIEGLTVRSYATGAELLSVGDLALGNCLVVDQNMPGMNGLDLITLLRPAFCGTGDPDHQQPQSVAARAGARGGRPDRREALLGNALLDKIRDAVGIGPG
jgi:CheY-like chemotaxis protein